MKKELQDSYFMFKKTSVTSITFLGGKIGWL